MSVLAFDLGASSGRAMLGQLNSRTIGVTEIHRFPNDPVRIGDRFQWDILRIYHEMKQGLLKLKGSIACRRASALIPGRWISVSWIGAGAAHESVSLPGYAHGRRDGTGLPGAAAWRNFDRTGIQFLSFNTIYQLASLQRKKPYLLQEADRFLMIPDLLRYFLTGEMANEFTNATTTQLYNPHTASWDDQLLKSLKIPHPLFHPVVQPGTHIGD